MLLVSLGRRQHLGKLQHAMVGEYDHQHMMLADISLDAASTALTLLVLPAICHLVMHRLKR
jgi:hypothetical protein